VVYEQRISSFLAQRQNEGLRAQTISIPGTATKRKPVTKMLHIPYRMPLLFGHKVELKEAAMG
jgi:hypothetical protein